MATGFSFRPIGTALCGLFFAGSLQAAVQVIDPDSLPLILPPTTAYGLDFDVLGPNAVNYQFRYTTDFGGTYRVNGSFFGVSETAEFLSCDIPAPQPGEPDAALLELGSGQSIDNGLEDGICTFGSDLSVGAINPGTFTGSGSFLGLRLITGGQTFFGYLQLRVNGAGELELLGGAIEDSPDTPIQTVNSVDSLFGDRFEGTSQRGTPAIASAFRLPHDPQFALSLWLRDEIEADIRLRADSTLGNYLIEPGNSPGFKRALVDTSDNDRAIPVPSGTEISSALPGTRPNAAWLALGRLVGADFTAQYRYLPLRFTVVPEDFRYGYLEIDVAPDGDLNLSSGDWNPVSNQPITTP